MKLTARFQLRMHEEYGSLGLSMVSRQWADPLGGMAAAHDMLEHFARDRGTVEEELMALGASLHVRRANVRWFDRASDNIGSDFRDQSRYLADSGREELDDPGRTRATEIDSIVRDAVEYARKDWSYGSDDETPPLLMDAERIVGWFRKGYRKAKARYRNIDEQALWYTFSRIEGEAERAIKRMDEGEIVTITAYPDAGWAELDCA